jgi:hypothetical protein
LPALQWLHHFPFGLSSEAMRRSLQQSEQSPHTR